MFLIFYLFFVVYFFHGFSQKNKIIIELNGLSTRENGLKDNLDILIIVTI